jgi:hypothetical protein
VVVQVVAVEACRFIKFINKNPFFFVIMKDKTKERNKKALFEDIIVFVDARGKKWSLASLKELVDALYMEADAEQVKKYYIKGKFSF